MSKVCIHIFNRQSGSHSIETYDRAEDAPWDRWMQLNLQATVRAIEDKLCGHFLPSDLRNSAINYLSNYIAEANAEDSYHGRRETLADFERFGGLGFEGLTDMELVNEFHSYIEPEEFEDEVELSESDSLSIQLQEALDKHNTDEAMHEVLNKEQT